MVVGLGICGVYEKLAEKELEPGDVFWWLLLFCHLANSRGYQPKLLWSENDQGPVVLDGLIWWWSDFRQREQRKGTVLLKVRRFLNADMVAAQFLVGLFLYEVSGLRACQKHPPRATSCWAGEGHRAVCIWKLRFNSSTTSSLRNGFSEGSRGGEAKVWAF